MFDLNHCKTRFKMEKSFSVESTASTNAVRSGESIISTTKWTWSGMITISCVFTKGNLLESCKYQCMIISPIADRKTFPFTIRLKILRRLFSERVMK